MKAILQRTGWRPLSAWSEGLGSLRMTVVQRAPGAPQAVAAMLGLAGPVAAGSLIGRPGIGAAVALGGLALSRNGKGETLREQAPGLIYALIAGSAAMFMGSAMAGHGVWTTFGIPAIAAAAALIGSISRPLAQATTKFIIYTIIAVNFGTRGTHPLGIMLLFSLGAAWTAGLSLVLRPLFQALLPAAFPPGPPAAQSPKYSAKQLRRRWRKSLSHLSGWQYTFRITLCLLAAQAFEWMWPHHHGYWVSITVVIVVQRNPQAVLMRTFQRAAGTTIGVLLTGILLLGSPPVWALVAMIAALAAARPILIEANYAAYAAIMTPLVILLLDFGREPSRAVIIDRLAATLAGCAFALMLGYLVWSRLSLPAHVGAESKGKPPMDTK